MSVGFVREPYSDEHRRMLSESHYLAAPPPGCLFAVAVRDLQPGLFGFEPIGTLRGVVLVGRPIARMLPQNGTVGELVRVVLKDAPYGTASAAIRYAAGIARARRMTSLIAYHDRTIHSGCIYRKAGFKKDGVTRPVMGAGWASRSGRRTDAQATSKRRWRLQLQNSSSESQPEST
tara:strand:+ start:106 stop:633 length:528 start_codon:yes stop_codon:yes gene_type:complete